MENFYTYLDDIIKLSIEYAPKLLLALATLTIGFWLIKKIVSATTKLLSAKQVEISLVKFLDSLLNATLKILLLISVASMVGIATTSFVAILGAAGLAIGLALQGSLANFASGVLILFFKPYKVGDFIEGGGIKGSVDEIQIFNTILKTPDNKTIIIPNSQITSGSITNYSAEDTRRVDMTFGIGYNDDIDKAKGILHKLIEEDDRVLKEPQPLIVVSELADSSVNFSVRPWTKKEDYWGLYFDMQEKVKKAFDAENISIPFPQTDIHIYKEN
jgi:small conductance mechanosensitive channel